MYFLLLPSLLRPPQVDFPKLLCTSLFCWTWPHGFTGTAPTNTFNPACFLLLGFLVFFFLFFIISSTVLHSLSGIKDHPQHHFHSPLKTCSMFLREQRQDRHTTRGKMFCLSNVKKHLFLVLGHNILSINVCVSREHCRSRAGSSSPIPYYAGWTEIAGSGHFHLLVFSPILVFLHLYILLHL